MEIYGDLEFPFPFTINLTVHLENYELDNLRGN